MCVERLFHVLGQATEKDLAPRLVAGSCSIELVGQGQTSERSNDWHKFASGVTSLPRQVVG